MFMFMNIRTIKCKMYNIRMMYRGFKQECPNGAVNEDTFKEIYEKFFPHGSKWMTDRLNSGCFVAKIIRSLAMSFLFKWKLISTDAQFPWSDVTSYAHHVFKAFDVNSTGSISFRVKVHLSKTNLEIETKRIVYKFFWSQYLLL